MTNCKKNHKTARIAKIIGQQPTTFTKTPSDELFCILGNVIVNTNKQYNISLIQILKNT